MSKKLLSLMMLLALLLTMIVVGPAAAEGETPTDPTPEPSLMEPAPTEEPVATEEPIATEVPPDVTVTLDLQGTSDGLTSDATVVESFSLASVTPPPIFLVKKDATGTIVRTWRWTIDKTADTSDLTLSPGQQHTVGYTVTVSAVEETSWTVSGRIRVVNRLEAPVEVTGVSDLLSNGMSAPVTCPVTFPYVLAVGEGVTCEYSASGSGTPPASNTGTATLADGTSVSDTVAILYADPVVTDECVEVVDTFGGVLGTVCAAEGATSFTFSYSHAAGPFQSCGNYTVDNTATFTTNDTGASGSDTWSVRVSIPCLAGCSLTPGYWKTHSAYGPAPYDDTWALIGEGTAFFLSGQSWYQVLWTSPAGGNAYYILAHAYIAASLNGLNGAATSAVTTQLAHAAALFAVYTPSSSLSRSVRADFINTASILDQYNNGLIGPGHCSE